MKKQITTLLGLFMACFLCAQEETVYQIPSSSGHAFAMAQYGPRKFVVAGISPTTQPYAILLNEHHQTIRFRTYKSYLNEENARFDEVLVLPDGFLFAGAAYRKEASDTLFKPFLLKTDFLLQPQRLIRLKLPSNVDSTTNRLTRRVWLRRDGQHIWGLNTLVRPNDPVNVSDALLMKWDLNLNLVFSQAYDFRESDNLSDFEVSTDGLYITDNLTDGSNFGASSAQLTKLDKQGDLLWQVQREAFASSMTVLPDGNVVLAGSIEVPDRVTDGWVAKFSPDGNFLVENTLGTDNLDVIRQVVALPNGNVLTAGIYNQEADPSVGLFSLIWLDDGNECRFWRFSGKDLGAISSSYNLMPNKNNVNCTMRHIIPLDEEGNSFISTGTLGLRSIWYSVLDQCKPSVLVAPPIELVKHDRDFAGIFPATVATGDQFGLQVEELSLIKYGVFDVQVTDAYGRLISNYKMTEQQIQILAPQRPGLYYVRVTNALGYRRTHRVTVEQM